MRVSSAVILNAHGELLVQQRQPNRLFPLHWELPGGKVKPDEEDDDACRREVMEELGLDIIVWPRPLITCGFNPPITVEPYDVSLYLCEMRGPQEPKLLDALRWMWCDYVTIPSPRMPSLNVFIEYLRQAGGVKHLRSFADHT